jgi:hypothetical protein
MVTVAQLYGFFAAGADSGPSTTALHYRILLNPLGLQQRVSCKQTLAASMVLGKQKRIDSRIGQIASRYLTLGAFC